MRIGRLCALIAVAIVTLIGAPKPIMAAPSPTGRNPLLLWTPAQQDVWNQMRADYEANPDAPATLGGKWYAVIKQSADAGDRYQDDGNWGALMYQITADPIYVEKAWTKLQETIFSYPDASLGGDYARENFEEFVVIYDWLYPGLTQTRRDAFLARLNQMAQACITPPNGDPTNPFPLNDSDIVVGHYFGLAFLYLVTKDYNPYINSVFSAPYIGGLTATAVARTNLRNTIKQYVTVLAKGGEWIESSEYNLGTLRLLFWGAAGVKTATGIDYFPEIAEYAKGAALRQIYFLTPDRLQSLQWGDEQQPRHLYLKDWSTLSAILAGQLQGDPVSGPPIQDLVYRLVEQFGAAGSDTAEPWSRAFHFFNPYAVRGNITQLPLSFVASGQGFVTARTGWAADSALFSAHMRPKQAGVDHEVSFMGNFDLYRKGTWVLTHPLTYSGFSYLSDSVNSMLLGTFSSGYEYKNLSAFNVAADGHFAYATATSGGQIYPEDTYDPPPTFLHEWTRSIAYLASANGKSTSIVVYDRTNMDDPRTLPKLTRYYAADQARMQAATSMKEWIIHSPVAPSISGTMATWYAVGGQQRVTVRSLLPTDALLRNVDETVLFAGSGVPVSERKWQLRISPPSFRAWDTFLTVVNVSDGAELVPSVVAVKSTDNKTEGALITDTLNNEETLILFNAQPGARLPDTTYNVNGTAVQSPHVPEVLDAVRYRKGSFVVNWTSSMNSNSVILADFKPGLAPPTATVDGVQVPVVVDRASGVARLTVSTAGPHTLAVDFARPAAPTGLRIIR